MPEPRPDHIQEECHDQDRRDKLHYAQPFLWVSARPCAPKRFLTRRNGGGHSVCSCALMRPSANVASILDEKVSKGAVPPSRSTLAALFDTIKARSVSKRRSSMTAAPTNAAPRSVSS